jgi:hypothetical protein
MSKVFVVQEPMKRDAATGAMVSIFNFKKALAFGELEVCLPSGMVSLSPGPTVSRLNDVLRNFSDDDYLLAAGDPSAIAIAGAIAANRNRGKFKVLKYDKEQREYISVAVDIYNRKD